MLLGTHLSLFMRMLWKFQITPGLEKEFLCHRMHILVLQNNAKLVSQWLYQCMRLPVVMSLLDICLFVCLFIFGLPQI